MMVRGSPSCSASLLLAAELLLLGLWVLAACAAALALPLCLKGECNSRLITPIGSFALLGLPAAASTLARRCKLPAPALYGVARRGKGFVRPSLVRQFQPPVQRRTPARRALLLAHFLSATCDATWELAMAMGLMHAMVNSLAAIAWVVVASSLASTLLAPPLARWMSGLNRLSAVRSLLVLERICTVTGVVLLARLLLDSDPGLAARAARELKAVPQVGLRLDDTPGGGAGKPSPQAPSKKPPSLWDLADALFPSWLFGPGWGSAAPSASGDLDRVFRRASSAPSSQAVVAGLVFFAALAAVARSARAMLLRRHWVQVIATSPYDAHFADDMDVGEFAAPLPVSAVGSLTPAEPDSAQTPGHEESDQARGAELRLDSGDSDMLDLMKSDGKDEAEGCSAPAGRGGFDSNLEFRDAAPPRPSTQAVDSYKELRAGLSQVKIAAGAVTTLLLGASMDLGGGNVGVLLGIGMAGAWHVYAAALEICNLRLAYLSERALQEEEQVVDSSVNFFDPYGSRSIYQPIGSTPRRPPMERLRRLLRAWAAFARSRVALASVAYALLFATVLDTGLVTLAYLRFRRFPVWTLGALVAVRSLSCGLVCLAQHVHQCTGSLAKTASFALWVVWATVCPSAVASLLFGPASRQAWVALAASICLSGPAIRAFGLAHAKLFKEWVEEDQVPLVERVQGALKLCAILAVHAVVIAVDSAASFPVAVWASVLACLASVLCFGLWYRMYDSGTPFQVVNDIGQLVLVVRG